MTSYKLSLSQRGYTTGVTEEDDPARARYLERLMLRKNRPKSNWRDVLATPMRHQKWMKQADERP